MERTIARASRLQGEVRVPGELGVAAQALWLAAIADGASRIDHVPPAAADTLAALAALGVGVTRDNGSVRVEGRGLRGLVAPAAILDLRGPPAAVLPALAILSHQAHPSRVRLSAVARPAAGHLLRLLARTGAAGAAQADGVLRLDGVQQPGGVDHEETDLSGPVKLALLAAALYGSGPSVVREPTTSRDRVDALLRSRGAAVEASRQAEPALRTLTLVPQGALAALDVDLPGELARALPFVVAALCVRRAEVHLRRVVLRPENRLFIDLARQIGASLEIAENDDGSSDLLATGAGCLKATRVADKRAEGLLDQVALLAILATQAEGEFIIRDIESLRRGEYDFVDHLVDLLRRVQAKVGEYPEGIVIDGGKPLTGDRIASRHHPGVAQAFAVAGLVAHGEMQIEDAECVDEVFPGFFDTLVAMTAPKAREKKP